MSKRGELFLKCPSCIMLLKMIKFVNVVAIFAIVCAFPAYGGMYGPRTGFPPEPSFAEPIPNITIVAGRNAALHCMVDNLGVHRVAWIKVDTQTVLTFSDTVVTHNPRINIVHNGHRNWDLNIRNIQKSDSGYYMCQINSSPMKNQLGYIEVVVPPDIIYDETSTDIAVPEGGSAELICKATGYPPPHISWRREDTEEFVIRNQAMEKTRVSTTEGATLKLTKITRRHMGAYLCIATNGIPPAVSKRIFLQVNFEPFMKVPNQLVGSPVGTDVTLECLVEASPKSVNYWAKETGEVLFSNEKYYVEKTEILYKVHMKLKIRRLDRRDFGGYKCIAKNSMGEADGSVQLYEHMSSNDSASAYKTMDSRKNPYVESVETAYTANQEYSGTHGANQYGSSNNELHYPPQKHPPADNGNTVNSGADRCHNAFIYIAFATTILSFLKT